MSGHDKNVLELMTRMGFAQIRRVNLMAFEHTISIKKFFNVFEKIEDF